MTRLTTDGRRASTVVRDNSVHEAYSEIAEELGPLMGAVSRAYIYGRIQERTGLCAKTIAFILNHTDLTPDTELCELTRKIG